MTGQVVDPDHRAATLVADPAPAEDGLVGLGRALGDPRLERESRLVKRAERGQVDLGCVACQQGGVAESTRGPVAVDDGAGGVVARRIRGKRADAVVEAPGTAKELVVELPALLAVTTTGVDVAVLPAASRATAVRVCGPLTSPRVSQTTERVVVCSAPTFCPSTFICTPATAALSLALAVIVVGPLTVPAEGAVIATVGAVVSAVIVAVAWFEAAPMLPSASSAVTL